MQQPFFRKAILTQLFLIFVLLPSCGGGTSGTGGENSINRQYNGVVARKVLSGDEVPLPLIRITLLQTGASATTDAVGAFSINTRTKDSEADFLIEGDGIEAVASIKGIPKSAQIISAYYKYLDSDARFNVESVEFDETVDDDDDFCLIFVDDPGCPEQSVE